jgi:hypothetical protein
MPDRIRINVPFPIRNALRASVVLLAHLAISAFMILCMSALQLLFRYLWAGKRVLLFDVLDASYIFMAADLAIIVSFLAFGLIEATRALMNRQD